VQPAQAVRQAQPVAQRAQPAPPPSFDVAVVWCWAAAPAARRGVVALSQGHKAGATLTLQAAATGKWAIGASTPILHAAWCPSEDADLCGDDGTRGCFILPTGTGVLCFAAAECARGQQLLGRLRTCALLVQMQLPLGERRKPRTTPTTLTHPDHPYRPGHPDRPAAPMARPHLSLSAYPHLRVTGTGERGVSLAPPSDAPPDWLVSLLHRLVT